MQASRRGTKDMREHARAIFESGLKAVDPYEAVLRCCVRKGRILKIGGRSYDLEALKRVFVIGAGKATAPMAQAIESLLADSITHGLICVKYGHSLPLKRISTLEAGHPLPDANGLLAAQKIRSIAADADTDDLVIVLISGGGSALLPLPASGITLEEKQAVSDLLLASGATIHEINAVRKHISAIKGGRLAQAAWPAQVASLILSDVVGDDLAVIASGPTVPDPSSFDDCHAILERYRLGDRIPAAVREHLQAGFQKHLPDTPDSRNGQWQRTDNILIGSNRLALAAAARQAERFGYNTLILSSMVEGETRVVAQVHCAVAKEILQTGHPIAVPACLLSGGETTVTFDSAGLGGRNQEFVLSSALCLDRKGPVVILSGGTDGTDGPTDAAGAIADQLTAARARQLGLKSRAALDQHDAYPYFKALGDLLMTGPTFTNVMDLRIILISDKSPP